MDARDPLKGAVMGSTMSNGDGNTVFPDQVLPFQRWLWFYTAGSAYAGGQEHERGMLKKGLVADLVILKGALDPENPRWLMRPTKMAGWYSSTKMRLMYESWGESEFPGKGG